MKTKVIRIQDKTGRGPYRPGLTDQWSDPAGPDLPDILTEFGRRAICEAQAASAIGFHVGCAFETMTQLQAWFAPHEIAKLILLGFRIVEMDVDNIICRSHRQLVFVRRVPLKDKIAFVPVT